MLDLIQMLFSWNGILTLIIALYVIDDVFTLGLKPKVRTLVGRDNILNKDPDVILLEQEVVRLEQLIIALQQSNGTPAGASRPEVKSPFAQRNEVVNATAPPANSAPTKQWKSWAEKQKTGA